jgi:hypothetical protein
LFNWLVLERTVLRHLLLLNELFSVIVTIIGVNARFWELDDTYGRKLHLLVVLIAFCSQILNPRTEPPKSLFCPPILSPDRIAF